MCLVKKTMKNMTGKDDTEDFTTIMKTKNEARLER
jgi:hypothetical protein